MVEFRVQEPRVRVVLNQEVNSALGCFETRLCWDQKALVEGLLGVEVQVDLEKEELKEMSACGTAWWKLNTNCWHWRNLTSFADSALMNSSYIVFALDLSFDLDLIFRNSSQANQNSIFSSQCSDFMKSRKAIIPSENEYSNKIRYY